MTTDDTGAETGARTDADTPADTPAGPPAPASFRAVPTAAFVALGFVALGLSPIAFQGGAWFLLFLAPVALALWVVRSRTTVDTSGLHVRGLVGTRSLPWEEVSTLRLADREWVRAVPTGGGDDLVLRGVRISDLGTVGEASGGRITVPTPAEAEAAEEHKRELEATRMRLARLREAQQEQGGPDDDAPAPDGSGPGPNAPGTDRAEG